MIEFLKSKSNIIKVVELDVVWDVIFDVVVKNHKKFEIIYDEFKEKADEELQQIMNKICSELQESLKVEGDWKIYPIAVQLIAEGRVNVEGREVFLDDKKLPEYGYRLG